MADALEISAQRIAQRGREVLLERLRGAFEEAAAAHADVLELDDAKLEGMIEDAVERADGLQWRRALASVATEELGIGLAEALGHPAVARAQAIVGAPTYEDGLAAIAEGKAPAGGTGDVPTGGTGAVPAPEVAVAEGEAETAGEDKDNSEGGGLPVSVRVVHLDGWPELEGHGDLELVFTANGLEVIQASEAGDQDALLSFAWNELREIEVHAGRGRVLRRRGSRLILSSNRRRARFDVRGVGTEELSQLLAPALARVGTEV